MIEHRVISLLLDYPSTDLRESLDEVREAVDTLPAGTARTALERFLEWVSAVPAIEVQGEYVATFDLSRRASLHLSYYAHGDRRQRGMALLAMKRLYEDCGLRLAGDELPDYLPAMLEFAAFGPPEDGMALLVGHRAAVELLRDATHRAGSPYAHLLDALSATLPALGEADREEIARIAAAGPPTEDVGLEPFAPPEVMPCPVGPPAALATAAAAR